MTDATTETIDSRLDMSASIINETVHRHLPWGLPTTDTTTCLLAQEDYVIGYSEDFQLPLWAAYTVTPVTTLSFISFHCCYVIDHPGVVYNFGRVCLSVCLPDDNFQKP